MLLKDGNDVFEPDVNTGNTQNAELGSCDLEKRLRFESACRSLIPTDTLFTRNKSSVIARDCLVRLILEVTITELPSERISKRERTMKLCNLWMSSTRQPSNAWRSRVIFSPEDIPEGVRKGPWKLCHSGISLEYLVNFDQNSSVLLFDTAGS